MKKSNKLHDEVFSLHTAFFVVLFVLLALIVYTLNFGGALLKTSVVSFPEHESFDGTTYPVKKVPNWVKISSDKWTKNYSELGSGDLINLPKYTPDELETSTDNLIWGNAADDAVRIAKITYSVPYMGNYKLDGKENAGSHLAVDIKVPEGTPVYAMANGTVIKASTQSSGFGHHIVLMHNNFPLLNNPNKKTTLYSSYSHLSDVYVSVGDVVEKGDQIGLSGQTGTATTPHLHFQLDNDEAPWHPFWPFTTAEANAAGLDFFSAINAGLGKESALETTVNPMKYVQKYMDYDDSDDDNDDDDSVNDDDNNSADDDNDTGNDTANDDNDSDDDDDVSVAFSEFVIETSSQYYRGQDPAFFIYAKNQNGNGYTGNFEDSIQVSSVRGSFEVTDSSLESKDFDDSGKATDSMEAMSVAKDRVRVIYDGKNYYSDWFEIVDPDSSSSQLFSDVPLGSKYAESTRYLASAGVINGYPDGTFKPDNTVTRVEALKLIFEAADLDISKGNAPFDDIGKNEWYSKYLYTAYKKKVVNGYPDGTFKPTNVVSRAEFFKMLFISMKSKVDKTPDSSPFTDVNVEDWFAPYVVYAAEIGIVDTSTPLFDPGAGMSRGEVADALYKMVTAKNS